MTTDPGDLVLDPTCGSGTTAFVAEQWGRRWITIDTSRVALALARARIMGAKYPWYLLADSEEGQKKIAEIERTAPATHATHDDIRHGFVYERVPHITLKSIANNAEIDVIWDRLQPAVEDALRRAQRRPRRPARPLPGRDRRPRRQEDRLHRLRHRDAALGRGGAGERLHGMGGPPRTGTPWPQDQRDLHALPARSPTT